MPCLSFELSRKDVMVLVCLCLQRQSISLLSEQDHQFILQLLHLHEPQPLVRPNAYMLRLQSRSRNCLKTTKSCQTTWKCDFYLHKTVRFESCDAVAFENRKKRFQEERELHFLYTIAEI